MAWSRRNWLGAFAGALIFRSGRAAGSGDWDLSVSDAEWGDASKADIREVCLSTAAAFLPHLGGQTLPHVLLKRREESPLAAYDRESSGQAAVYVTVQGRHWSQLAFQFAHEFAHVLAMHAGAESRKIRRGGHENLWFEESVCEAASLFALRWMAEEWKENAPYPNWRPYASSLKAAFTERAERPEARLPKGVEFSNWFRGKRKSLRENATDRNANSVIASRLLPVFEARPGLWEAVVFLNARLHPQGQGFEEYTAAWRAACPEALREGVDEVRSLFG